MMDRAIQPVLPNRPAALTVKGVIASELEAAIPPDALRDFRALPPSLCRENRGAAQNVNKAASAGCAVRGFWASPDRLLSGRNRMRRRPRCRRQAPMQPRSAAGDSQTAYWGRYLKRGLAEGPAVARTLKSIEDRWVEAGFPTGDAIERIVRDALASIRPD